MHMTNGEFKQDQKRVRVFTRALLGTAAVVVGLGVGEASGTIRTWDGGGASSYASEAANWSDDTLPNNTDQIVLDSTSGKHLFWDAPSNSLPDTVAAWTQVGYTGTVTFQTFYPGQGTFTNFTIEGSAVVSNGAWTHLANPSGGTAIRRLAVTVMGGMTLGTNSVIQADGRGFAAGYGSGKGLNYRHGGGYGGLGAAYFDGADANYTLPSSATYGSITGPTDLGSGGQSGGMAGGGAILLAVTGDLVMDGTISVGGGGGWVGGSGGSIQIRAGTISGGTGSVIRANGGSAGSNAGSGGGGRVAVVLTGINADFVNFKGRLTAIGGDTSNYMADGAAGTVYSQTQAQGQGQGTLIIDNGNRECAPGVFTLMPSAVNVGMFAQVVITNKGNLAVDADDTLNFGTASIAGAGSGNAFITLTNAAGVTFPNPFTLAGYTLRADAATNAAGNWIISSNGALSHTQNIMAERYKLNLSINGSLTIASNGAVNADGLGYFHGYGPGRTTLPRHGGTHGGVGATYVAGGSLVPTGMVYGSLVAPVNLGSGGQPEGGKSMSGGGAIKLVVTGALTNNGSISANGAGWPGGAGGSVFLKAQSFAGGGAIRASGGAGDNSGGGGGGRVAVVLTGAGSDFAGFTGAMTAYGGNVVNDGMDGGAGTVYRESAAGGRGLWAANFAGNSVLTGAVTQIRTPAELSQTTVFVTNVTILAMATNAVFGDLYLQSAGSVLSLGSNAVWNGFTLTIRSREHSLAPGSVRDYGSLVWRYNQGALVVVR